MAFTSVPNNPANQLLPYYPTLTTQLTELTQACDPLNGNYFVATGRDLVTFIAKPSSYAPAWLTSTIYTQGQVVNYSGSPFIALANVGLNQGVSPEALSFSITSVAGGTGVYTGTITGGAANAFAGYYFVVTGFSNLPNNGTFVCTASTTTTLTLQNAASVLRRRFFRQTLHRRQDFGPLTQDQPSRFIPHQMLAQDVQQTS
jgi:chitodextrinase